MRCYALDRDRGTKGIIVGQVLVLMRRTGPGRNDWKSDDRFEVWQVRQDMAFYFQCDDTIEFYDGYGDYPDYYARPTDFNKVRQWVRDNVESEGNQERYFELLDLMEADSELFVTYG